MDNSLTFGVVGLNHGHIYGQVEGLLTVPGARCAGVAAEEADLLAEFSARYPRVPVRSREAMLADPAIDLIVSAAINAERGPLAAEALRRGKHVFVDKPPVTTLGHVEQIARALESSGRQMFVFYGERMANRLDIKAKQLVDSGRIGRLVHLMGLGPHLLRPAGRPAWMFDPARYGGILNDICSHQVEWFVWLTGQRIAAFSSRVGHYGDATPATFDDFGDATLTGAGGTTGYVRVDWFTPERSPIWGDVRGMVVGTQGVIEIRRTINLSSRDEADRGPHLLLTTAESPPERVDASACAITWPADIARSIAGGVNCVIPHDVLLHVMETTVRIQQGATRVR